MNQFIERISNDYKIDKQQLLDSWTTFNNDHTRYNKMKKPELVSICNEKGFMNKGSKSELVKYIMDEVKQEEVASKPPKEKKAAPKLTKVLDTKASAIVIRRNKNGNYEHEESSIVFDHKTKKAIGTQQDDGSVVALTKDDISNCKKFNFDYDIPESFDNANTDVVMGDDNDISENELFDDIGAESSDDEIEY